MGVSPIAQAAPRVAVFDVNETLSDLSGLVPRLKEVGAPPDLRRGQATARVRVVEACEEWIRAFDLRVP